MWATDRTVESRPFRLDHAPSRGGVIHGEITFDPDRGARPTVVVCHGFKGFGDWGFFPPLAVLLASRGLTVVRFNHSSSGVRPGEDTVSDPEAFRHQTFGVERDEVLAVLAALGDLEATRAERPALFGHSRGGAAVLLAAANEAWRDRLGALVTWASIATVDRWSPERRAAWRAAGQLDVPNARTGQVLPIGLALLDEVEGELEAQRRFEADAEGAEARGDEALDLERAAGLRRAPWLIVHGTDDETVPLDESVRLERAAAEPVERRVIAGAGHTFGARHPFAGPTRELTEAMNATQRWLHRHLVSGNPVSGSPLGG